MKIKPCYSLSNETLFRARWALYDDIRRKVDCWLNATGESRAKWRGWLKSDIAAHRQLVEFAEGKMRMAIHRKIVRGMSKSSRRWLRKYRQERRAESKAKAL